MEVLALTSNNPVDETSQLATTLELFHYQEEALGKLLKLGGSGGLFLEMGTGKTRVAIALARTLRCRRVLVAAPLSTIGVWQRELKICWPSAQFFDCTASTIRERAQVMLSAVLAGDAPYLCIVGYESYWREPLRQAILKSQFDIVLYDEAHRLKGRSSKQSRFAHRLSKEVKYRVGLTGTPMPNGPEDLFGVYRSLRPEIFGEVYSNFEYRYIKKGGYLNYQIIGYRNLAELEAKVAATSFRITKAEALDLPEQIDVELPIELVEKTRKVYEKLRKAAIAEVEGFIDNTPRQGLALADTVLTNVLRLQQITGGWVKVSDGRIIDLSHEKEKALLEILEDAIPGVGRVVIFCRFRHDIDRLDAAIKWPHYVLDGRSLPKDRQEILDNFKASPQSVLIAQVAVGSLGIDLSCASVAVFYSVDYSLSNYLQSRDRLHRIGQVNRVTYYSLVARKTIDEKVYRALSKKENLARTVLDLTRARKLFEES